MYHQYEFRNPRRYAEKMTDYILHQSYFINENQKDIIEDIVIAHKLFRQMFPESSSTWSYNKYNVFSLTACSTNFYEIYKELRNLIRSNVGIEKKIWMQSWINYLKYDELKTLDWHGHDFPYHGYISIDPKNTQTVFKDYTIENKVGQIYLGPGHRMHKVVSSEPYLGDRITIGFDIVDLNENEFVTYKERPWKNMSFIPLL